MRIEQLLFRVRRALAEGEPLPELAPLIESAEVSTQQTLHRFLSDSEGDVEMTPASREAISQALQAYLVVLARMRVAALAEDRVTLHGLGSEAQKSVMNVRQAQSAHQASLAQGATVFPYLNRLLLQFSAARAGGDRQRLLGLLRQSPGFLQWLRFELAGRTVSPVDAQAVFHLQQLLQAVEHSVQSGEALPDIQPTVVELAPRLAGLLAEPLKDGPPGQTKIPAVDRVFQALEICTGADEEVDFLLAVVDQCRTSLQNVVPTDSPAEMVLRLNFVLSSLDKMDHCLRERTGFEDLVAAAGQLEASSNTLFETVLEGQKPQPGQPGNLCPQTLGLPLIFRSVLEPAYAFVDGRSDRNTVAAAADHLESAASKMQKEASRATGGDARLQAIQEALELMREAAETLRGLAASGNANLLEFASSLCRQAAERLEGAGVK